MYCTASASRRIATAALMVASSFVFAGCEPGIIEPVDACPNLPGFQAEGPCEAPGYSLSLHVEAPGVGFTVYKGGPLTCRASMTEQNAPAGSKPVIIWLPVDGVEVVCVTIDVNRGPELVTKSDSVPITRLMSVGAHTVSVKGCNDTNGVCLTASSFPVNIDPEPDQILVRIVEATYPNWGCVDIWTADAVPGATLRRLTTGCNKGTFAVTRDGKTLWYTESGTNRIWKSGLDGSNPVAISVVWNGEPVTNITNLRVSPDGSKISFTIIALDGNTRVLVMNADGTGVRSLVDYVPFIYTVGPGSAWMPDSQHLLVGRDSVGLVGLTGQTVQNEYLLLDLETGEEKTVYVAKYGEDQFNSILRGISDNGGWFLTWNISTTRQATITRTDGSEVRPLTERDKNAAYPIFCGEAAICALTPTDPNSFPVSRIGFDGKSEVMFTVFSGKWIADLAFLKAGS